MDNYDDLKRELLDLARRVGALEDALRTYMSSPQDDVLGSSSRAFGSHFMKGNGHVSQITLGADGESLSFRKVK